MSMNCL